MIKVYRRHHRGTSQSFQSVMVHLLSQTLAAQTEYAGRLSLLQPVP